MISKFRRRIIDILERHVVLRFILSGGTSAFVDLLILYLLNSVFEIYYLTSAIIAFIVAFGVSFTLHKFWTFRSHGERAHKQVILYLATSLLGLLLNTVLMYIFVRHVFSHLLIHKMKLNVMVSQIVVGLIVA